MDGVKSSKTPMSTTTKLNKDENGKPVDQPSLKDDFPKDWQFKKAHAQDFIIVDTIQTVTTHSKLKSLVNLAFISQTELKNVVDALCDEI